MSSLAPPSAASTTEPSAIVGDDPRDRRRLRAALICVAVAGTAGGMVISGFLHRYNVLYGTGLVWFALVTITALCILWASITLSTRDAVRQLIETTIAMIRTSIADTVKREIQEQLTQPGDAIASDLSRIKDRLGLREDDDPTCDLVRPFSRAQAHATVYSSASISTGYGTQAVTTVLDRHTEACIARFETAFDALLTRANQVIDERLTDVAEVVATQAALGGRANGGVTHLPRSRT